MPSIVTGEGLGLFNNTLNPQGQNGSGGVGKNGDRVHINSQTGNLVIQHQDEFLKGAGLDQRLVRTYNSQGLFDDDNGDNWRLNIHQSLHGLIGMVNTTGSTVTKVYGDGGTALFTYDGALGHYISHDGGGSHDTLSYDGTAQTWQWSNGTPGVTEHYDVDGRLISAQDGDGNVTTYGYTGTLLTEIISSADNQHVYLDYAGNNLIQIRTLSEGLEQTRIRYDYDALDRLSQVSVDLTPEDNSQADGNVFTTGYSYDGDSHRITRIDNSDGTSNAFTYQEIGGEWRLKSFTDGEGKISTLDYGLLTADPAALIDNSALKAALDGNVEAHWTLDQTSGTSVTDATAQHNGTLTGGSWTTDPERGEVLALDGSSFIKATGLNGITPQRSISIWFRAEDVTVNNRKQVIYQEGGNTRGLTIYLHDGVLYVGGWNKPASESNWQGTFLSTDKVASGQWHNVNLVLDGDTTLQPEGLKGYLDGEQFGAGEGSQLWNRWDVGIGSIATGTRFHDGSYSSSKSNGLTGTLSDARIYNHVLDAHEIAILAEKSTPTDYEVQLDDTWASIAEGVYGDARAAAVLQSALGDPSLVAGSVLALPADLEYAASADDTVWTPGSGFSITDPLGYVTRYQQDGEGRLARIIAPAVDGESAVTEYSYDADDNLILMVDAVGKEIHYDYDSNGNLIQQQDSAGNVVQYRYDGNNQKISETRFLTLDQDGYAGSGQAADPITERYAYDSEGHLRFHISGEGNVTEYRYNATGQQVSAIEYLGASYDLSALTQNDDLAEAPLVAWIATQDLTQTQRVDSRYDFRGQRESVTTYSRIDAAGNGLVDGGESITRYVYDQAGQLLQRIDPRGEATADPSDYTTHYSYDGLGRLLSTTDALGSATLSHYDDAGNRVLTTLANGLAVSSVYDKNGRLVSTTEVASDATPLGTTSYHYDEGGRLRHTVDPTGRYSYTLYDEAGRLVATINHSGELSERVYDSVGNLLKSISYSARLTTAQLTSLIDIQGKPGDIMLADIRPPEGVDDRINRTVYDDAHRIRYTLDAKGYVTENIYDGAGRLTDQIAYYKAIDLSTLGAEPGVAEVAALIVTTGWADRHSRNFYNNDGQLIARLDGAGYLTEIHYDGAGQAIESIGHSKAATSTLWADGSLQQLLTSVGTRVTDIHSHNLYNVRGQLVGVIDGEGYLTETVYDAAGNLTQTLRYSNKANPYSAGATLAELRPAPSAADQIISQSYNALNQLTSGTNAEGTTTHYKYDNAGNLIERNLAFGTLEVRTLQTRYDQQGRVIAELSAEGTAQLTGNQTQEEIDVLWATHGKSYAYDMAGRRISVTDANGHTTLLYYNDGGRLAYQVNALGEVNETRYNAFGQVSDQIGYINRIDTTGLSGGAITAALTDRIQADAVHDSHSTNSYSQRGLVKSIQDALGNGTSYGYNGFGEHNVTWRVAEGMYLTTYANINKRGQQVWVREYADEVNRTTKTTYDAFGRTISTTDGNGNKQLFTYDKLGRALTTENALGQGTTHSYDAFGRELTQTDALGNTTTTIYDDTARTITHTTPEGISHASGHNRHGETVEITDGEGNVTRYQYDKNGQLVQTLVDPDGAALEQTQEYNSAGQLIETTDANGTRTVYTYDAANRLLSRTLDPEGLNLAGSYRYDGLGRVAETTDANGVATRSEYDVKGQLTATVIDPITAENPNGLNLRSEYQYDGFGRQVTLIQGAGTPEARTVEYHYDMLSRRTQEIVNPDGLNLITQYHYDLNDNLVAKSEGVGTAEERNSRFIYDAANRLTHQIDAAGGVTVYTLDANGQSIKSTGYATPIDLTGLGLTLSVDDVTLSADPTKDNISRLVYNDDGQLIYSIDSLGGVNQSIYNDNGQLIQSVRYADRLTAAELAQLDSARSQTVPENGRNIVAGYLTESTGDQINYNVYDSAGRLIYVLDGQGQVSQYHYDNNGNRVSLTNYDNPIVPALALGATALVDVESALIASAGDQSHYSAYDNAGRLIYDVDSLGQVSEHHYDSNGNRTRLTEYAISINPQLALGANALSDVGNAISGSTNDRTTQSVYDAAGRARFGINALGYVSETRYDIFGQAVEVIGYANSINLSALGDNPTEADIEGLLTPDSTQDQHSLTDYNQAGQVIQTTDAEGHGESYSYDALGNQLTLTNKKGDTWHYRYDAVGQLIEETTPTVEVTRLSRDAQGDVQSTTTEEAVVTQMAYDTYGNLTSRTEAYGTIDERITHYEYDALGRQIKTRLPTMDVYDAELDQVNSYQGRNEKTVTPESRTYYDNLGNAIAGQDVLGNYSYKVYNTLGQVRFEIDAERYVTEYQYDAFGNQTHLTRYINAIDESAFSQESGTVIGFKEAEITLLLTQDNEGVATDRTLQFDYDLLNRLIETRQPEVYNYDSSAAEGEQYFTAGPTTRNEYNRFGEVIKQSEMKNTITDEWIDTHYYFDSRGNKSAEIDALGYITEYQYDANGNLTEQTEYAQATTSWSINGYTAATTTTPQNSPNAPTGYDRVTRYEYDRLNRKTEDILVNREYSTHGTSTVTTQVGNLTTQYQYDEVGNLTTLTDSEGNVTRTYYDALGRSTGVAEPSFETTEPGLDEIEAVLKTNTFYVDVDIKSAIGQFDDSGENPHTWRGDNRINLYWPSLEEFGDGDVRIDVTYHKSANSTSYWRETLSAADGMRGASLSWEPRTSTYSRDEGLSHVSRVKVWKTINGHEVLLHDSAGDNYRGDFLTWDKPVVTGSQAVLDYWVEGEDSSTKQSAVIEDWGSLYAVDLSAVATGRYEYQLSYTRNGEIEPYAQQLGSFVVEGHSEVTAHQVVGVLETPFLGIDIKSAVGQFDDSGENPHTWRGDNRINLGWQSLEGWGDGDVRVDVTYHKSTSNTSYWRETLSAADGMRGASLSWEPRTSTYSRDEGLSHVSSVKVWKTVNNEEVLIHSVSGNYVGSPRLLLRGDTAGLTGIDIAGVGVRNAQSLGAGMYAVDLNGLSPAVYNYTVVGSSSSAEGVFTIRGNTSEAVPMIQENLSFIDIDIKSAIGQFDDSGENPHTWRGDNRINLGWQSLEGWGDGDVRVDVTYHKSTSNTSYWRETLSAAEGMRGASLSWEPRTTTYSREEGLSHVSRVKVWKTINGQEVLIHDSTGPSHNPHLVLSNLPTTAQTVEMQYRQAGTTDPYLTKATTKVGNGWFTAGYADMANGAYEYQLIIDGDSANPISGSVDILRGGQSLPQGSAGTTISNTPISSMQHDIYGNVVQSIRYAEGAASVASAGYVAGLNPESDQHGYTFYNSHGHSTETIDAEGNSIYNSYDAQGNVIKQWQPYTNTDGVTSHGSTGYSYDRLGQQTALYQFDSEHVQGSRYNAFGEIEASAVYTVPGSASDVTGLDEIDTVLATNTFFLDVDTRSAVQTYPGDDENPALWEGENRIELSWQSLEDFGDGDVRVNVTYQKTSGGLLLWEDTLSAAQAMRGASFGWETISGQFSGGQVLSHVSNVKVWKTVNGQEVLLHDSAGDSYRGPILTWEKPVETGSHASLEYWIAGEDPSTRKTATIQDWNALYAVELSAFATGRYEYQLSYTRNGETEPYAQGTGTFAVEGQSAVSSNQITGVVETPFLGIATKSAVQTYSGDAENPPLWEGENRIELSWQSLEDFGDGNVRVNVTYQKTSGGLLLWEDTLSAANAMRGASFGWETISGQYSGAQVLSHVSNVKVWKTVNGQEVLIHNVSGNHIDSPRLLLRGDTAGLTGIDIAGIGVRNTVSLGAGLYAVDLGGLDPAVYSYTVIGGASAVDGVFTLRGNSPTAVPMVQENLAFLDIDTKSATQIYAGDAENPPLWSGENRIDLSWRSLEDWGDGNVRVDVAYQKTSGGILHWEHTLDAAEAMRGASFGWETISGQFSGGQVLSHVSSVKVWKTINGQEVLIHDTTGPILNPHLALSNLPTTTQTVEMQYRKAGSTDLYLTKSTTKAGNGWFTTNYDDLANGAYEYKIIIDGDSINPISGTFDIMRGGQSLPQGDAGTTITHTPMNSEQLDEMLNSESSETFEYDANGRVWRTNQEDGVNRAYLYNTQGQATAEIQSAQQDLTAAPYVNPETVSELTDQIIRTDTLYDQQGRMITQIQPSFETISSGLDGIEAVLKTNTFFLDVDIKSAHKVYQGDDENPPRWGGDSRIDLSWQSLEDFGDGNVRVDVTYHKNASSTAHWQDTFTAAEAMRGASFGWESVNGQFVGEQGLSHVSSVKVWKTINGQEVLLHDSTVDSYRGPILTWEKPAVTGGQVILEYWIAGEDPSTRQTATIQDWDALYAVELSALATAQYEYQLTYTRNGEAEPYAQGTGTFAVEGQSAVSNNQITGAVETPFLGIDIKSAARVRSGDSAENTPAVWIGSNRIDLKWQSLEDWGDGEVRVDVTYYKDDYTHAAYNSSSWKDTYTAAEAMHGVSLDWEALTIGDWRSDEQGLSHVSSVKVWKTVNGQEVLIHNVSGNHVESPRLLLRGDTAGLTGIDIAGIGVRNAVSLGAGLHAVDLSGLAPAVYSYSVIGSASAVDGVFTLRGNLPTAVPMVQENLSFLDVDTKSAIQIYAGDDENPAIWSGENRIDLSWQSLEDWGDGNVRVDVTYQKTSGPTQYWKDTLSAAQAMRGASFSWETVSTGFGGGPVLSHVSSVKVWKTVNGQEVLIHDTTGPSLNPHLVLSNLPTTAQTVEMQYRKAGTTDPYLTKATTKVGTGWFTAGYADMANGAYEYQLIIDGDSANPISGSVDILRGGQSVVPENLPEITVVQPTIHQTHDRWGNVLSVSDARDENRLTNYQYNYLNNLIQEIKPETDVWAADGTSSRQTPTTNNYYDARGLMIGSEDANGNLNRQTYDPSGRLTSEIHADGGVVQYSYDTLGNLISKTDANGNATSYQYDRNNRLIKETQPLTVSDYHYDERGNRISVINGNNEKTDYFYDSQGNLINTRLPMGQINTISYDAHGNKIEEINANNESQRWEYDTFGHLTRHTDLGGEVTTYTYNSMGQLIEQTSTRGQQLRYSYYGNGALKTINDDALKTETHYEIDAAGNRIGERFIDLNATGGIHQDIKLHYDELGRLQQVKDNRYELSYKYDANGNRRNTASHYYDNSNAPHDVDNWYTYDAMNRINISQGELIGGQISITQNQGSALSYDSNGNRRTATSYEGTSQISQSYLYDDQNRLLTTHKQGHLTSARAYDQAGRVSELTSYSNPGVMSERRVSSYNQNGWALKLDNYNSSNQLASVVHYDLEDSYDAVGNLKHYSLAVQQGGQYTNDYRYEYAKFDSYKEQVVHGTSTHFQSGDTTSVYDVNGNLISVDDKFNTDKHRDFVVNTQGQVLKKSENGQSQYYYYANGNAIGSAGELSDADFDYNYTPVSDSYPANTPSNYVVSEGDTLQSIALAVFGDAKLWYLIADANGLRSDNDLKAGQTLTMPNQITNIHNSYDTFKPYNPGQIIGDTTPTLPDPPPPAVNGAGCGIGQVIVAIVAIVVTIYTAGALSGVTSSLTATMNAGLATIQAGTMTGTLMASAAVGSVASQMVGMAIGVQDKFSWGAVASSALTAGVMSASGIGGSLSKLAGKGIPGQMAAGAIGSVVGQGINIVTGQQDKFDWRGVAAAAIAAPITNAIDRELKTGIHTSKTGNKFTAERFGTNLISEASKSVVRQGVGILVHGKGKMNWAQVASDGFGNAIGNSIVEHAAYLKNHRVDPAPVRGVDLSRGGGMGLVGAGELSINRAIVGPNRFGDIRSASLDGWSLGPNMTYSEMTREEHQLAVSANGGSIPSEWWFGDRLAVGADGNAEIERVEEQAILEGTRQYGAELDAYHAAQVDKAKKESLREDMWSDVSGFWNGMQETHYNRFRAGMYQFTYEPGEFFGGLWDNAKKGVYAVGGQATYYMTLGQSSWGSNQLAQDVGYSVSTKFGRIADAVVAGDGSALGEEFGFLPGAMMEVVFGGSLKLVGGTAVSYRAGKVDVPNKVDDVARTVTRDQSWFDNVALNATRNPDSNRLVLGHFAREGTSYQKVAAHYEASYFKVDDWNSVTKGLSNDEIWRINETFLDQQVMQGKQILFSHNPLEARPNSFFEREVNYLQDLGYKFNQKNQWTWDAVYEPK